MKFKDKEINIDNHFENLKVFENKDIKDEFKIFNVIKKNWAFILFSFINAFIPIVICLIASTIPNKGTETMLAISFSSPFQLVFLTIPFILTFWFICFVAKIAKKYNNNDFKDMFWIIFIFNLIVGLFLSLLFFISAYCYVNFFYAGTNMESIADIGELFVSLFTPIIFINSIGYVFTFLIFFKFGSNRVAILELLRLCFIIIFSFIFCRSTDMGSIGIGIGVLIGSLLSLLLNFIICFVEFKMWKYKYSFNFDWVKYALKSCWKIVFIKIFASLVKPLIFFAMGAHKNTQDPNFMIAKSLWYFILYFITFFSDGISKIFMYHKILNENKYSLTKDSYKSINILFLINFLILIFLSIGAYFITNPLGEFLVKNQESINEIDPNNPILIQSVNQLLLLPNALAILFTLFYCTFNSVNQIITDIKPMFEKEKSSNLITTLITILIVIAIILCVGLLIMELPIVGGLSAFTIPMFAISFIFGISGVLGWTKFWKKSNKNIK